MKDLEYTDHDYAQIASLAQKACPIQEAGVMYEECFTDIVLLLDKWHKKQEMKRRGERAKAAFAQRKANQNT